VTTQGTSTWYRMTTQTDPPSVFVLPKQFYKFEGGMYALPFFLCPSSSVILTEPVRKMQSLEKFSMDSPQPSRSSPSGASPPGPPGDNAWTLTDMSVQKSPRQQAPSDSAQYSTTVGAGPLGIALAADKEQELIVVRSLSKFNVWGDAKFSGARV
jgi:hypothetical protein